MPNHAPDRLSGTPRTRRVTLVATYELGRQPFGLASPAAWLREAAVEVTTVDLSREPFRGEVFDRDLVAFHLPMHTATRLALPVIRHLRAAWPETQLCAYGLYAALNEPALRELGVQHVLGGEFEEELLGLVLDRWRPRTASRPPRLRFRVPDRSGLPRLDRYATLQDPSGGCRVVGYTEASRGCKHHCRHCPVVPVYDGQFRVVPRDVVLSDVRAQVEAGAQHITFGDPDFLNGVGHAVAIVKAFGREFPDVTYDVTIKVEHLLRHADHIGTLRETGCAFVVTAAESVDDAVLARLAKGHTQAEFERVVDLCRVEDVALVPTFIPFTPWTTVAGYLELLETIHRLDLVESVTPVQLSLRLLLPRGSRLLALERLSRDAVLESFDEGCLLFPWRHRDPVVDQLQTSVADLVGRRLSSDRAALFRAIWGLAAQCLGSGAPPPPPLVPARATVPYLNEPWYC